MTTIWVSWGLMLVACICYKVEIYYLRKQNKILMNVITKQSKISNE